MNRRSVASDVFRLAWPAVLQGLVATVVFFTDRLILGRYGTEALGSTAISGPVVWSVFSVVGAYNIGVVAVVGRAIGRGDPERARRVVRASLGFSMVLGGLIALVGVPLAGWISDVLGGGATTSESVRLAATQYMQISFAAGPLLLTATAGATAMQAAGNTITPMRVGVVAAVVNLGVSWTLVFGHLGLPELGVRGAAIGTAVAFAVELALILWALRVGHRGFRVDGVSVERDPLRPVMRIAWSTYQERVIYHSAYVGFVALIGRLGDVSMAAHQSLIAIESISFIAAGGFGVAAATLVAQRLGADRPDEAETAGWISAGFAALGLSMVSLLFLIAPEACVRIFTDDPAVIRQGATCLRIAAIAQPLMALTDAFAGALRGAGDTRTPMIAALVGPVAVRLTACWVLAFPLGLGLVGIWIGSTLDWAMRAVWLGTVFRRGKWKSIRIDDDEP